MTVLHLYVFSGKALLPTVAQTEDGFFLDVNPVSIVLADDAPAFTSAFTAVLAAGNPLVAVPTGDQEPGSVLLEALGLKRWETFERQAIFYSIHCAADRIALYITGRGENGLWAVNEQNQMNFPADMSWAEFAAAVWQDVSQRRQWQSKPVRALLAPPPAT